MLLQGRSCWIKIEVARSKILLQRSATAATVASRSKKVLESDHLLKKERADLVWRKSVSMSRVLDYRRKTIEGRVVDWVFPKIGVFPWLSAYIWCP